MFRELPGIYRNEEPKAEDSGAVIQSCHKTENPKNSGIRGVVPAPNLVNPYPAVFKGSLPPTSSTIWTY